MVALVGKSHFEWSPATPGCVLARRPPVTTLAAPVPRGRQLVHVGGEAVQPVPWPDTDYTLFSP